MSGCSCHPNNQAPDRPNIYIDAGNLPTEPLSLRPGQKLAFTLPLAAESFEQPRVIYPTRHFMWDVVPPVNGLPGQPEGTQIVAMAMPFAEGDGEIVVLNPAQTVEGPQLVRFKIAP